MTRLRYPALVREAIAILSEHGHAVDLDLDGKHLKVRWIIDGKPHLFIVSRSPSDRRSKANSRAVLRRLLREEERAP
ncbi:MAG: hypothetical protein WAN05_19475 [Roseiarcus sp.]